MGQSHAVHPTEEKQKQRRRVGRTLMKHEAKRLENEEVNNNDTKSKNLVQRNVNSVLIQNR